LEALGWLSYSKAPVSSSRVQQACPASGTGPAGIVSIYWCVCVFICGSWVARHTPATARLADFADSGELRSGLVWFESKSKLNQSVCWWSIESRMCHTSQLIHWKSDRFVRRLECLVCLPSCRFSLQLTATGYVYACNLFALLKR